MKELSQELLKVTHSILEALQPTPVVRTAIAAVAGDRWDSYLENQVDPTNHQHAAEYFNDAIATSLLKKYPARAMEAQARRNCLADWLASERADHETNIRFAVSGITTSGVSERVAEVLRHGKNWLADVLGRTPSPEEVLGRFGPGVSVLVKGERKLVLDKLSVLPECTSEAVPWYGVWCSTAWARELARSSGTCLDEIFVDALCSSLDGRTTLPIVAGNRFVFVDKTAKMKRGIAAEPLLNGFYQLGVGSWLRQRLNRVGLLVPTSQENHRDLAHRASIDRTVATVDLHAASDRISVEFVRAMLPPSWYTLLAGLRCPFTVFDEVRVRLEKFSSMGNGYTFELETALFSSLVYGVLKVLSMDLEACEPGVEWSCYGDDIILPDLPEVTQLLYQALGECGLVVNTAKSYCGALVPFRESCGGDYHSGVNVRPIYIDRDPASTHEWYSLYNKIYRLQQISGFNFETALGAIQHVVPRKDRLFVPPYFGDVGFHCDDREKFQLRDHVSHDVSSYDAAGNRRTGRIKCPSICIKVNQQIPEKVPLERWHEGQGLAAVLYGVPTEGVPKGTFLGSHHRWVPLAAGNAGLFTGLGLR